MTAMHKRSTSNPLHRACIGSALGAALMLVLSGAGAQAQQEFGDRDMLDKIMGGIGLKRQQPDIEYRERSPLVVPPSRELRPPQTDAVATKNPAWPQDQDVKRAQELERKRKSGDMYDERRDWFEGNELRPSQLDPGRAASNARKPVTVTGSTPSSDEVKPSELGWSGWTWQKMFGSSENETVEFKEEPARETLLQPPPGYRTPSPAQPYGLSKSKEKNKPANVYDAGTHQW
jgi:hypothetical protein